jgi:hypothetical protein
VRPTAIGLASGSTSGKVSTNSARLRRLETWKWYSIELIALQSCLEFFRPGTYHLDSLGGRKMRIINLLFLTAFGVTLAASAEASCSSAWLSCREDARHSGSSCRADCDLDDAACRRSCTEAKESDYEDCNSARRDCEPDSDPRSTYRAPNNYSPIPRPYPYAYPNSFPSQQTSTARPSIPVAPDVSSSCPSPARVYHQGNGMRIYVDPRTHIKVPVPSYCQ